MNQIVKRTQYEINGNLSYDVQARGSEHIKNFTPSKQHK